MSDSEPTDDSSETTDVSTADQGENDHVIFVDGTGEDNRQTYDQDIVDAVTIIEEAGYEEDPERYILEALERPGGDADEQFDPQGEFGPTQVDLTEQDRTHFQVTTRGEVFI